MESQILAVQRMQDYIEQHINEKISINDLAKVAMYSSWYSYRLFVKWTKMTPSDYIRRLKLSKSALKLRDEKTQVTDVAFELGFNSVDGYQRAFFREFGINPKEYSKEPTPISLFIPYGVKYTNLKKENKNMENIRNIFIQEIEKPDRKVIIKRAINATEYMTYCEEVGCDVWGVLSSIKSISNEPVCLWLPEKLCKPITNTYVQGVEVDLNYDGIIPEGFDIITLPKATYLKFQGEPFADEDFEQAITELQDAIKKFNPNTIGHKWDNTNPRIQLEPLGARGYIELVPICK